MSRSLSGYGLALKTGQGPVERLAQYVLGPGCGGTNLNPTDVHHSYLIA